MKPFLHHLCSHCHHFQCCIFAIHCLDYMPRCPCHIRLFQHIIIHRKITLILFKMLPVGLCHPPSCLRRTLQFLKPLLLFIRRNMQKELDDQCAIRRQLFFKRKYLLIRRSKFLLGHRLIHLLCNHTTIPASVKNMNTPLLRCLRPESPQKWMHPFFLILFLNSKYLKSPRIKGLYQSIDQCSFPGCPPPFKYDHHRQTFLSCFTLKS